VAGVIAFKGVLMFGTKLRHKVFSLSLFCLAAALLVSVALKVYEQGTVTFNTASGFGGVLFILSIALIPEFFFLKFSEALELRVKSRREKISEKLLYSGMLLVIIGFIGRVAL
jgi:cytochrome c biogenesis factor